MMWITLIPILTQAVPVLVHLAEMLFRKPKSGVDKENLVVQTVIQALTIAHEVDPKDITDTEVALIKAISSDLVTYFNTRGVFKH